MADTQRLNMSLEVTEPATDPAGDSPAGETAANGGVTIDTSAKPADKPKEAPKAERPAWLPEGFETPEALAESYKALRAKMSKEGAPKGDKPKAEEKPSKGESSTPVDSAADDSAVRTAVTSAAGDEVKLKQTLEWAKANASDAAVTAYNTALKSGDPTLAALAFGALKAEYAEATGEDPALLEVESSGRTAGVKPFASENEMVKAMSDPRYKEGDPAYHREVEARLKVSNIW